MFRRTACALLLLGGSAAADPIELGGFFGPRVFSTDSALGYIDAAPAHPMLENTIEFGARVSRPFFPWLTPELEFAMAPTHTSPTKAPNATPSVDVFWFEPRLHLRFDLLPGQRLHPFLLVGGGSAIALSSARKTIDSGIVGDGYVGAGARFDTQRNFIIRLDARLSIIPGADHAITTELDFGVGLEFVVGDHRTTRKIFGAPPPPDMDHDGIPDDRDNCPTQPEDKDGFQDEDGCPDIDNDLDRVLDIADKCPMVPETYNGFEDDDGCPDVVPPDVDGLRGTVEGLLYADAETAVRDSAMPNIEKIAGVMKAHPSIKVILIGHTDDQEAKQFATPEAGQPAPDIAALSADLSRARAEAVKQVLVAKGIDPPRITVEGHGSDEPVVDNTNARARLANRRVEIRLFVPPR